MPTTASRAFRYPAPTDVPDGPQALKNLAEDLDAALLDTGWVSLPWTNDFTEYAAGSGILVRRSGAIAALTFVAKAATADAVAALAGTSAAGHALVNATPLAAQFRPTRTLTFPCRGSGTDGWALAVTTAGNIYAYRYGPSTPTTGSWLPANVTWMIG